MVWTSSRDLKNQLTRLWERQALLRALISDEPKFPLRLTLKSPSSSELANHFEAVRVWVAELMRASHYRIQWREFRHRLHGLQRLPEQIWVDTLEDALTVLGKRTEAQQFIQLRDLTQAKEPALLPWLVKYPLQAIRLIHDWPNLLKVVDWLTKHPRPGIYLRQVDIPGIHSKFIEKHRAVLSEMLDLVLPTDAINLQRSGISQFSSRYGFLDKATRIRFRLLDEKICFLPGAMCADITLDAASFARLELSIKKVFITENETNFLAFPKAKNSIVIFGSGYGWEALASAHWLHDCALYYWGDIDTHGFAILNQLRNRFAHVRSFLMDRDTLYAHQAHWGEELDQALHDLPRLTAHEAALYNDLRKNQIQNNLRLEQERIGFDYVAQTISRIGL